MPKGKNLIDQKGKKSKHGHGTDGQDVEITDLTIENNSALEAPKSKAELLRQKTNSKL